MKEDIKYPTILKSMCGSQTVVVYKDGSVYHIDGEFKGEYSKAYNTDGTFNAASKVLANTYGKVDSKEHAEFIVKLAKNAGFRVSTPASCVNYFIIKDGLSFHRCEKIKSTELKQITIPLPPKEVEEVEEVDEWPKVGSKVTWGEREIIGIVKCVDKDRAWILCPSGTHITMNVKHLHKPKTPEEELRDDIEYAIHHSTTAFTYAEHLAKYLLDQYTLTKKQ